MLEPRRRNDPHHHEIFGTVIDDLVLDLGAEEAGGAFDERMPRTIDHHVAPSAEADLQLDLIAVRVLAHAAPGRDGLVAHRELTEPRVLRIELRIGVPVGGHRLPVRRTFVRLHDDTATARLDVAHEWPPGRCVADTNSATARPISAGESSWMKWLPGTVTSRWLGHVRQKSRW